MVELEDGFRDFGLDILKLLRPLKEYSFSHPPNRAKEDSDVRDRRLANKKEVRNLQQAVLKGTMAQKRVHPKAAKAKTTPLGIKPARPSS
jgi:hypothetical protein